MQYVTCPKCGANLDHGERCDCEEHKKEEPPHANESGSSGHTLMPLSIIAQLAAEHKCLLKEIRESGCIVQKDIVTLIKSEYPGYDKALNSKCENPERYGVGLTPGAMQLVIENYAPGLLHSETKPAKRRDNHRLTRRIHCRLTDEDYDRLMEHIHGEGFDTVQAWLTYTVRRLLKTERSQ